MRRRPCDVTRHAPRWVLACLLGVLVGCRATPERTRIPVFAASSLTEAFTALATEYERTHPRDDVQLTFAGSQVLRVQIEQGAPAQVFASANAAHVEALVAAGQLSTGQPLARNRLALIVPDDNPAGIATFADLSRAKRLVIGTPQAPIGQYTDTLFTNSFKQLNITPPSPASRESNVRLVRAKVALGEADAAIVYRSDARAAGLRGVPIPAAINVAATYQIAVTRGASTSATAFVDFARSPAGQRILAQHGFDPGADP